MKTLHIIGAAALLGILGTVPATAKVNVIQSPSAALARGSSFAWAPVPARGFGIPDPRLANEVTADRLRALTEITLTNKGYHLVADASQADFLIGYTVVIVPDIDTQLATTQGTLVLDLIERETGRLVWRATSEKQVTGQDVSQEKLAALLKQMTKSLPAQ